MKVKILKVEKNDLTQKFVTLIFCHVCLDERNESVKGDLIANLGPIYFLPYTLYLNIIEIS